MIRAPQRLHKTLNKFFSSAEDSPGTCHGLRDIFHLLGHMEPRQWFKEWPSLRAPFKPNDLCWGLSLPSTFFCSKSPHSRCHLSSAKPAVEQMEPQSKREVPALCERIQHCAPNTRASPSERESGEGDSSTSLTLSGVAWLQSLEGRRWMFMPDPEPIAATANEEEAQDPISSPHNHPRLLNMDQMGKVAWICSLEQSSHGT